jgi:hypothetical protein
MNDLSKRLIAAAKDLSAEERVEVVEQLLNTLHAPDPEFDALWVQEAEDRLAAYRRGEIQATDLAAVVAKYAR